MGSIVDLASIVMDIAMDYSQYSLKSCYGPMDIIEFYHGEFPATSDPERSKCQKSAAVKDMVTT